MKCGSKEGVFDYLVFNVIVESNEEFYSFLGICIDLNGFNSDSKKTNVEQVLSIFDGKKVNMKEPFPPLPNRPQCDYESIQERNIRDGEEWVRLDLDQVVRDLCSQ